MELNGSYCSLWNTNDNSALVDAWKNHASFQLRCVLQDGENLVDTMLDGNIAKIDGLNGVILVQEVTVLSEKSRSPENLCTFSIKMTGNIGNNSREKGHAITGTARIQIIEKDKNANIRRVLLRFDRCYTVRPLRASTRYKWDASLTRLFRVILPGSLPATREELSSVLKEEMNSLRTSPPTLIDISAGGLCACLPRELAQISFSSKIPYLVFFLSSSAQASDPPFIFLARRLGIGSVGCNNGTPIRMRFMAEMDWSNPTQKLRWFDVRDEGSPRLNEHLTAFKQYAYV